MSETSWLAIFTSGDSDVGDITEASEQLSKTGFSGGVAEVSDEDLSGGFSLVSGGAGTVSSFLFRSGLFDGQRSAFEFVSVEGQSLVEAISVGELDEGDTLGSAIGASQNVNLLDSSAGLEKFLNAFLFSCEGEVSNKDLVGFFNGAGGLSNFVGVLHV